MVGGWIKKHQKIIFRVGIAIVLFIVIKDCDVAAGEKKILKYGTQVPGKIQGVDLGKGGFTVFVEYKIDGKRYEKDTHDFDNLKKLRDCYENNTCEGKKCYVKYMPNDPTRIVVVLDNVK